MNKLIIIGLFFGAIFQFNLVSSQTNLVPNPSFEEGNPDPTVVSQLDTRCKDWKNFNTSDWYKEPSFTQFYFDQFQFSHSLSAHTGQGYIGFGGCEGAQAKLIEEVEPGSYVRISLWFTPREHSDSEINVYLLHEKAPEDALEDCFNPNIEFEFFANIQVNAGGADAIHEPGTWYQYTSEELFVARKSYKWIAIKGENTLGAFGDHNYVYVDDISAIQYPECEHECAPDLPTVEFVTSNGLPTLVNTAQREFIFVENATNVLFQVFYPWGPKFYELKAADPSGLVNRSGTAQNGNQYQYFAIEWAGTDEGGNYITPGYTYTYVVTIWNCNSIRQESLTVDYLGWLGYPPGQTQQMAYPDHIVNAPPSCCIENWIYQDETFASEHIEIKEVEDYIHLGEEVDPSLTIGPVIFEDGSETYLNAGNEVVFYQGVTIEAGAMLRAEVGYECPPGKRDISFAVNNQTTFDIESLNSNSSHNSTITLFPNPSNGELTINGMFSEGKMRITIFNNLGKKVFYTKKYINGYSFPLNISNLASGIYMLHLHQENQTWNKKIIIK